MHFTRLLAVRHGETAWNVDQRIQGHLDIPLNDTGHWQARQLAGALAREEIAAIYASDLQRAAQTAQPVAETIGLPVCLDEGLRERAFGDFEGLSFEQIQAQWPEQARRWRLREADFTPQGAGESLRSFALRIQQTVDRLARQHAGQQILLVAHGGVMDALYRAATRLDTQAPRSWQLANAAVNRLLWTPEGLTLVGWADTQHLDQNGLDEGSA
jgi:probable phosphoglycerate mutase